MSVSRASLRPLRICGCERTGHMHIYAHAHLSWVSRRKSTAFCLCSELACALRWSTWELLMTLLPYEESPGPGYRITGGSWTLCLSSRCPESLGPSFCKTSPPCCPVSDELPASHHPSVTSPRDWAPDAGVQATDRLGHSLLPLPACPLALTSWLLGRPPAGTWEASMTFMQGLQPSLHWWFW